MSTKVKPPASVYSAQRISKMLVIGVVVCGLLLFSDFLGKSVVIERGLAEAYQFVLPWQVTIVQQVSTPWRWIQFARHGDQQLDSLEQQLAEGSTKIAEAEFLRQENEDLRAQLEAFSTQQIGQQQTVLTVSARVVTASGVMGIDQGSAAGIHTGDMVFSRGYVIGTVTRVDQFFAEFSLTKDGSTPMLVKTLTGVQGVLTGEKGTLLLTEVANDQSVGVGHKIYTVGSVDQGIPPGLVAGEINDISQTPQAATRNIIITQPGNERLPSVVVIRRYEREN